MSDSSSPWGPPVGSPSAERLRWWDRWQARPRWQRWGAYTAAGFVVLIGITADVLERDDDTNQSTTETSVATTQTAASTTAPPATTVETTTTTTSTSTTTTTETAVNVAPTTTVLPSRSYCIDDKNDGVGNFDLIEASISRLTDNSGYLFTAAGLGPDWEDRDWGYSFNLDGLSYVFAGMNDDGTLNNFVIGPGTPIFNWISDGDSFVFEGSVNVVVSSDWLPEIADSPFDWDVLLLVDGIEIDECAVADFEQTGDDI